VDGRRQTSSRHIQATETGWPAARASQTHSADWAAAWRMYLSWLLRGVAAEASCDPGPVGVALMSGNVLQPAAKGFLFDLYLDPAQNFSVCFVPPGSTILLSTSFKLS
jgi:hypothetical protein